MLDSAGNLYLVLITVRRNLCLGVSVTCSFARRGFVVRDQEDGSNSEMWSIIGGRGKAWSHHWLWWNTNDLTKIIKIFVCAINFKKKGVTKLT